MPHPTSSDDSAAAMPWQRLSPYCLAHTPTGARIAKGTGLGADGQLVPVYLAYGPDRAAGWSYRAWSAGSAPHWSGTEPKVCYALGEPIAQPSALLGRFLSAEEAKAAIEDADLVRDATKKVEIHATSTEQTA
jgi:hypothetical protein